MTVIVAMIGVVSLVKKKQAIATQFALIVAIFLVASVGYVYVASDSQINGLKGFFDFMGVYFSWIGTFFENVRTITANAIKLNWNV